MFNLPAMEAAPSTSKSAPLIRKIKPIANKTVVNMFPGTAGRHAAV
jgi:hypothetical protein